MREGLQAMVSISTLPAGPDRTSWSRLVVAMGSQAPPTHSNAVLSSAFVCYHSLAPTHLRFVSFHARANQ